MATRRKARRGAVEALSVVAHICVCALGLTALTWGALLMPYFWRGAALNRVTAEIVQGHTFALQTLVQEARLAASEDGSACDPMRVHDGVILRLAAFEQAIAVSDQSYLGSAHDRLDEATRAALACSPADGFGWLTLFWLEVSKHGYQPTYGNYLRLSYALAPYEGWIALWRSKLALAVLDRLPDDLCGAGFGRIHQLGGNGTALFGEHGYLCRVYHEKHKFGSLSSSRRRSRLLVKPLRECSTTAAPMSPFQG